VSARQPAALPFPFDALPALSRVRVDDAALLRRVARRLVRLDAVAAALAEVVGEPVAITRRAHPPADGATLPDAAVAVAFGAADAASLREGVLVAAEPALAAALVTRALRQKPPRVVDPARPPSGSVAGALAGVLHAALRRAHTGVPLRVLAAGPAPALGRDLSAGRRVAAASLSVTIGREIYDARVLAAADALLALGGDAASEADGPAAADLGDVPLALPLVAATALVSRAELASLGAGDVFVVPRFALAAEAAGGLVGPVALVPPRGERGLDARLASARELVVRTGSASAHPWDAPVAQNDEENSPPMSTPPNATLDILDDAPVVVRVELGSVEMKAREWAAVVDGDVLTLGRKLGDPAVLRVGGVEVARGELVQVDGEYGVRIVRREGR
jgi:flagellar motor switch protein FliN/FliY